MKNFEYKFDNPETRDLFQKHITELEESAPKGSKENAIISSIMHDWLKLPTPLMGLLLKLMVETLEHIVKSKEVPEDDSKKTTTE